MDEVFKRPQILQQSDIIIKGGLHMEERWKKSLFNMYV